MIQNDIITEQLHAIAMDQPVSERAHYVETVLEALDKNGSESALLYQLFKELDKVNDVEFGKVPDSKGDITRYAYYDHLSKCIEVLSGFEGADNIPNITRMNKLHNILLNYRADFEFGFKRDIVLITTFYNTIAVELCAMIDLSISDYTNYLKLSFNDRNNGKFNRKDSVVISQVDSIIKIFESGQWSTIMKAARAESVNVTSDPSYENYTATEAIQFKQWFAKAGSMVNKGLNKAGDVLDKGIDKVDTAMGTAAKIVGPEGNMITKGFKQVMSWFNNRSVIGKVTIILGAVVAILLIIRGSLYVFGRFQAMMSGFARNQATLLKAAMDADRDSTSSAVTKQQRMVDGLQNAADLIDFKYKKAEDQASKDIATSNKEIFSTSNVTAGLNGVDFGF